MAEVLVEFNDAVVGTDRKPYLARACGSETGTGTWQGWLEFVAVEGGPTLRTGRETTQPNRTDTVYWATGLTAVYLEGALERALHPLARPAAPKPAGQFEPPSEPAPDYTVDDPPPTESILNPFSVYRKGESILRSQLGALSAWHLVNIVRAHALSDATPTALNAMTAPDLIDLIVTAVKARQVDVVPR
jgi:hypothetical protein